MAVTEFLPQSYDFAITQAIFLGVVEEGVSDQHASLSYGSVCIRLSTRMLKMRKNVPETWKTIRKSFTLKTQKNRQKMSLYASK